MLSLLPQKRCCCKVSRSMCQRLSHTIVLSECLRAALEFPFLKHLHGGHSGCSNVAAFQKDFQYDCHNLAIFACHSNHILTMRDWLGWAQVEGCTLRDYEGNYDRFLEKNEGEAEVMAEKQAKKRELEKSQIKAKSKVRPLGPAHAVMQVL